MPWILLALSVPCWYGIYAVQQYRHRRRAAKAARLGLQVCLIFFRCNIWPDQAQNCKSPFPAGVAVHPLPTPLTSHTVLAPHASAPARANPPVPQTRPQPPLPPHAEYLRPRLIVTAISIIFFTYPDVTDALLGIFACPMVRLVWWAP